MGILKLALIALNVKAAVDVAENLLSEEGRAKVKQTVDGIQGTAKDIATRGVDALEDLVVKLTPDSIADKFADEAVKQKQQQEPVPAAKSPTTKKTRTPKSPQK